MLTLEAVTVRFGKLTVLDGVSLEVTRGEVLCLLGPSGSGKSTMLRVIAGIERPAGGRIAINGVQVSGPGTFVESEQRRVGMVFQDYALFPHLTVAGNVTFGLKRRHEGITELLERLGLKALENKYPHQLSGGESQRVALARAMAPKPGVLLMDEPFSSLDSRLRDDVRRQTLAFVRESQTTTVIVTHDPNEAMRIGDRIALLDGGRLVQCASPMELYSRPSTLFAARFFSDVAAVPGTCREGRIETSLGSFPSPSMESGEQAVACIRPQHFRVASQPGGVEGHIMSAEFCGENWQLLVKIEHLETPVAMSVTKRDASSQEMLKPGTKINLEVNGDDVPVVPIVNSTKESFHAYQDPS